MDGKPPFDVLLRQATDATGLKRLLAPLGAVGEWRPLVLPELDGRYVRAECCAHGAGLSRTVLVELRREYRDADAELCCRGVQRVDAASVCLVALADQGYRRIALATCGLDGRYRRVVLEPRAARRSDAELLEELAGDAGASTLAVALRHARVLDRAALTRAFFRDFRALRERVAESWTGIPSESVTERAQLALLFLCRLMFLYFLQRQGRLAGRDDFLIDGIRRYASASRPLYASFLQPLFFAVLNTRIESRSTAARELGDLPYLNGGLFERHALERRHPRLVLPDDVVRSAFEDVLERYRFSGAEHTGDGEAAAGISPEMMGLVFENLMAADRRSATGTYYTPRRLVQRVVRESVAAYLGGAPQAHGPGGAHAHIRDLRDVRVLDPACGSGAFLVGALEELARRRAATGAEDVDTARRDLVTRALHGVDLQEDAALLCALRLWLALAPRDNAGPAPPLPNLDRRIRQGDALVDPLDLAAPHAGGRAASAALDPAVRRCARAVEALSREYANAEPRARARLQKRLTVHETRLARAWLSRTARDIALRAREERGIAESRDLFGEQGEAARQAAVRLQVIEAEQQRVAAAIGALADAGALPYFSFPVHFARAGSTGFDLIFCNPPWLRAHRWAGTTAGALRAGYEVCRDPGWRGRATSTPHGSARQIDLSLLFLERSLQLLAPGGVLGIVLPAKLLRSLYAGGARRLILRYADIVSIEDHSLDQRSVFRADSFTCVLILKKREAAGAITASSSIPVTMIRRHTAPLRFEVARAELSVDSPDDAAPWLLAPAPVAGALRQMLRDGVPLGSDSGLRIRRGLATGANDVFVLTAATPRLGGLTSIEAVGARRGRPPAGAAARFRAYVESEYVAKLIRGCDVAAWQCRIERRVLCAPPGAPQRVPPRLANYLRVHGKPLPSAASLSHDLAAPKVVWHDLARTLKAVAIPASPETVIPLNTVYFVSVRTDEEAFILAALLNSTPMNALARALAERAKDAHFRFFAWLVTMLPLPAGWRDDRVLLRLSRQAHGTGGLSTSAAKALDDRVAEAFRLRPCAVDALRDFDRWLRGTPL